MRIKSLAVLVALGLAVPASAAQFSFSFTPSQSLFGTPFSGSGVFTTSDTAMTVGNRTAFAILGITGTIDGSSIVAPNTGTSYGNYFTTGGFFLDGSGVSIATASGRTLTFFNQSNNNLYRVNSFSPGSSFNVTATSAPVSAVPEPASWALMIGGMGLAGGAMRRRAAKISFA